MTSQQLSDRSVLFDAAYDVAVSHAQRERPYGPRDYGWESLLVDIVIEAVGAIVARCSAEPAPSEVIRLAAALKSPPWWRVGLRAERRRLELAVENAIQSSDAERDDYARLVGRILERASRSTEAEIAACWRACK